MYNVLLQWVCLNNNNKKVLYTCSNSSLNSIHGFSLVWKEKQYLQGIWGEEGRKYALTQLFLCVVALSEDRHKNGCEGDQRGRSNAWWLSILPRLPLPHSPWKCSFSRQTYWILLTSTKWPAVIKRCGWFDAFQDCGRLQVGSCKLPFIQVEIVVVKNT